MPSPFPGMDPYIEGQRWADFHHGVIALLQEALVPRVRPRYEVRVEERVYLEYLSDEREMFRPDVSILEGRPARLAEGGRGVAIAAEPVVLTLPLVEAMREAFLTIRLRDTHEVVTVIEVLSPSNKDPRSDGHSEYLRKRNVVLRSQTHLVELDLLRGGERLPTREPLPPADFYAFVSRAERRPKVEIYPWTLRDPLPPLPVPLRGDDPDVVLDLQSIFTTVYDRAGYDYSLDYDRPVEPPLGQEEMDWVRGMLNVWGASVVATASDHLERG